MPESHRFTLDPSKIRMDEEAKLKRKEMLVSLLRSLEHKRPIEVDDLVTTIDGPYAHQGMKVVKLLENGVARIAPAPETPAIEIPIADLFHFDDYKEAMDAVLVFEQQRPEKLN